MLLFTVLLGRLTPEVSAILAEDAGVHDEQDDRFPGDAGTMEENDRNKVQLVILK